MKYDFTSILDRKGKDAIALDLAKEGLKERNIGEEIFLEPLYRNVNERTNPGKRILDSLKEGISLEEIIKDYGDL